MISKKKPSYEELEQKIKAVEQAGKNSNLLLSRLSSVMETARLGYWEHDIVRDVFTLNDHFYRLLRTAAEHEGGYTMPAPKYLQQFVHPDDVQSLNTEMRQAIESGNLHKNRPLEHRCIRRDGTVGHLAVQCLNTEIKDGRTVMVFGVIQDITERKEVEERLRAITDSARDAILMMDPRGDIQFWNPAAGQILGYSADEALGKNLHRLLAPKRFHSSHFKAFQQFVSSGTGNAVGRTLELTALRKDGREIPVELSMSSVSLNGEWHAVGVLRDITDRKKVEEALRESEKRFRDLSEMLPEVVFETDREMNLTFVNQQAFTVFEYSRADFENGLNAVQMIAPEDRKRAMSNTEKQLRGEFFGVKEYLGLKKNGSIFPMLLHASPIMSKESPVGLRGIIVDITERKKIQEQLLQGEKMKSIGTLAAGIAHDFNNILQPMLGYCGFLKSELPADSPHRGYVEGIFKASMRAKELVKQILTFSRQSKQKKAPVQVKKVLKEAVKLARATIPSNIQIQQDAQSDPAYIMADPTQLHQIIMNLIINAYHAVAQTGGRISINLINKQLGDTDPERGPLKPGGYALLSVSDTGCGIDPAIMDKIFEPYFTTRSRGEGSGLGLAVVYGIVKDYGGDIKVRSEVGKGTTINVYLPLTDKPPETVSPEGEGDYPTGNERILFVDDEDMIVEIGSKMLERLGYQVTSYLSSLDALKAFKADPNAFDLVISDMAMPHMTGDQLASELLALRPGVPVIICSGYSERVGQNDLNTIGVSGFLMKPISISELSRTVRSVLDGVSSQP